MAQPIISANNDPLTHKGNTREDRLTRAKSNIFTRIILALFNIIMIFTNIMFINKRNRYLYVIESISPCCIIDIFWSNVQSHWIPLFYNRKIVGDFIGKILTQNHLGRGQYRSTLFYPFCPCNSSHHVAFIFPHGCPAGQYQSIKPLSQRNYAPSSPS